VESGNARTPAIKQAYRNRKAGEYRKWLKENVGRFGLKPEDFKGVKNPVLVRISANNVDRQEFVKQANESNIAQLSAMEQAVAEEVDPICWTALRHI